MENFKIKSTFIGHLTFNFIVGLGFIIVVLFIGTYGYHVFENMSWIDAFANAAMIVSGMGLGKWMDGFLDVRKLRVYR